MNKVHYFQPVRTIGITSDRKSEYRELLRNDFKALCCYCGKSEEIYNTRKKKFEVEHFRPRKYFKELEFDYYNLSFCCDTCNRKKWDYWPSIDGNPDNEFFVDVADDDANYQDHLIRDDKGKIYGISPAGLYMADKLDFESRPTDVTYHLSLIKIFKNELLENKDNKEFYDNIESKLGIN